MYIPSTAVYSSLDLEEQKISATHVQSAGTSNLMTTEEIYIYHKL